MLNVIKSNVVIEEQKNFVLNLPKEDFSLAKEQTSYDDNDDKLDFYTNIEIADEDELNDNRYFYIKDKEEQDKEEQETDEQDKKEQELDFKIEELPYQPTQEELLQEKLDEATKSAEDIIEKANKQAKKTQEQIEQQLALAEEKANQAKSIADSVIEDAHANAQKIIDKANEKAKDVLEQAQKDGFSEGENQGREQGHKEGFTEGEKQGIEQGLVEGEKQGLLQGKEIGKQEGLQDIKNQMAEELEQSTQKAKEILIQAELDYKQKLESTSDQIVTLVMSVASRVLNKQIEENPFLILQMVKEAAKKVIEQPRLFINVNSQNYDIVFASCNELKKELGSKQELSVVADSSLGLADVVITTGGSGDVDARLETQMSQVRKAIESVIK